MCYLDRAGQEDGCRRQEDTAVQDCRGKQELYRA